MGLNVNMLSRRILITLFFILAVTTVGLGIRYAPIGSGSSKASDSFESNSHAGHWCSGAREYLRMPYCHSFPVRRESRWLRAGSWGCGLRLLW